MINYCAYALCLALTIQNISPALAQEPDFLSLRYDTLSEGKDVGDVTFNLSQTEDGYLIVEHNHIKTSGWWGEIDITTVMFEEFQHGVGLIKSDSKTLDDDTAYWTRISRHDDGYLGKFTEVSRISSRETQQFFKLSSAVTRNDSLEIEEIAVLSKAIFPTRNDSTNTHNVKFTLGSFSTTLYDFPFFIQLNADKPLPKKISILNSEEMDIHQVSISDLGLETLLVGSKAVQVRHLVLSDEKSKPSHLWLKEGVTSLPYIVRHTGEDEDGAFEIILKAD